MAVGPHLTFVPGSIVPAGGVFAIWTSGREASVEQENAGGLGAGFGMPTGEPSTLPTIEIVDGSVRPVDVPARVIPVLPAVRRLAAMPPRSDWPAWSRPPASVLGWSVAAKLALEHVAAGRILPAFHPTDVPGEGRAWWRVVAPSDGRAEELAAALPTAAHALRSRSGTVWPADELVRAFLDAVADALAREGRRPEIDARRRGPRRPFGEMWAGALSGSDPVVPHLRLPAEEIAADVEHWAEPLVGRDRRSTARLAVRLEPPGPGEAARLPAAPVESPPADDGSAEPWGLAFFLQSAADPSVRVDAREVWDRPPGPLELGDHRVEDPEAALVRGLATAARLYPPVDRALSENRPTRMDLDAEEVARLLADGVEALAAAGIGVELPPEVRGSADRMLRLRVRIGQLTPGAPRVEGAAPLGLSSVADLRYEVALGDQTLSPDEFAAIVELRQPLVRWRGSWVRVDQDEVDRIRRLAGESASLELTEALAAALSGHHHVRDLGWVETVADGAVGELIDRLRESDAPEEAQIVGIEGELRPYQERGVAWLQRLAELGMGAVLADEMGLGKTLQAIALITSRQQDRPHLVVCPTSVVGNWERELARFAPGTPVVRHHGSERAVTSRAFRPGQVAVTSYALLRRDVGLLEDVDWDVVILDEAQQIKNPSSKGARAARSLRSKARVAMTGTPIENRLSELWSVVDVTNPGLLGSQRAFNERFAVPVERWHDEAAANRLRRLVAPFVLRRRKDDPEVAVDLPPKQELTVTCGLTREQAALYQAAVEDAFRGAGLGSLTSFERRGRILALLTALKQICNHPAQYLRDVPRRPTVPDPGGRNGLEGRSGKLARVTEILAELVDADERALVFTQFREMGDLLVRHLTTRLGLPEVPFLHGGVPLGQRDQMVARFQQDEDAPPVLLVSLRAGGTGLNLTRANHVVHYDRWWNPAVEDQATDRAHRIGQTRTVTVHTLVAAGTVEERIAELLDRKRALADAVVGTGETWITELDDEELHDLVALSTADLAEVEMDDEELPSPAHPPRLTALPGGRT